MYVLEPKTKFKRDVKLAQRRNWDLSLLKRAMDLLIEDGTLPKQYASHPLKGQYKNCVDAHIKPDWVIIYESIETEKVVILHRTGKHQDVFTGY